MCIHKEGTSYACCCGCPLIVGVIILFLLNILELISAIQNGQWFSIMIYSVLTIWFVGSFVQRHNYNFRRSLFMSYGLSFAILLIYILYMLIFDDSVDNIVDRTCDLVTDTRINWKNCNDFPLAHLDRFNGDDKIPIWLHISFSSYSLFHPAFLTILAKFPSL